MSRLSLAGLYNTYLFDFTSNRRRQALYRHGKFCDCLDPPGMANKIYQEHSREVPGEGKKKEFRIGLANFAVFSQVCSLSKSAHDTDTQYTFFADAAKQ